MYIAAHDERDYQRGAKRSAKDFRRALLRQIEPPQSAEIKAFDFAFRPDTFAIVRQLSRSYEAANAVGLSRSESLPPRTFQGFLLFHEALNLSFVAFKTVRNGSVLASDGILRQALELGCVAFQVSTDESEQRLRSFLAGSLDAPKAVSSAKRIYEPIGRLYGNLTNSAVHASTEHANHSIRTNRNDLAFQQIRVGAWFDPENANQFRLGLIRVERVAISLRSLIEAAFFDLLEAPAIWSKQHGALVWANNKEIAERLKAADRAQKEIEESFPMIFPWAISDDVQEVKRLLGVTEGPSLQDASKLRQCVSEKPDSFVAHYLLGGALEAEGRTDEATQHFEAALRLRAGGYDVWARLEALYRASKAPRALERFYRRTLARDPNHYEALHNLGLHFDRLGKSAEAVPLLLRAHKTHPDRYRAAYNLANAYHHLANFQSALTYYRKAGELDPASPEPFHNAGVACLRMSDCDGAYRAFRHAVLVDPGYLASWINLSAACRLRRIPRRALCCALRAQRLAPEDRRVEEIVSAARARLPNV